LPSALFRVTEQSLPDQRHRVYTGLGTVWADFAAEDLVPEEGAKQ
jgi:hypothetical protein